MKAATHPDKIWWTAREIAGARLPDMPSTRQGLEVLTKRLGWRSDPKKARQRSGRGGGWEYNWGLFPARARRKLLSEAGEAPASNAPRDVAEVHAWYDGLPERVKKRAITCYETLMMVVEFERSGVSRLMAVDQVAQLRGVSDRTIWNWLKMVDGVAESDRLCHLAPRNRSAERSDKKAECSPEFFERLKGDCLRLERPSFASCYRRTVRWCRAKGKSYLPNRTARRRLNELVARVTQVFGKRRLAGDTARAANTDEVLISNYNLGRD